DDEEDIEQEVLTQSICRISSQMAKLSNIIVDTVDDDDVSGKFSSFPIDMAERARHSDDSVADDSEGVANVHEHTANTTEDVASIPTDPEVSPTDPEVTPTDPKVTPTVPENSATDLEVEPSCSKVNPTDPEMGTTSAACENVPPSPDGSTTFIEDAPAECELGTSTRRMKSKTSKIRSFFKRKTKKDERKNRYKESSV
ncbi:Hypothetical predicted protein, partial [Paramuricea clavata]